MSIWYIKNVMTSPCKDIFTSTCICHQVCYVRWPTIPKSFHLVFVCSSLTITMSLLRFAMSLSTIIVILSKNGVSLEGWDEGCGERWGVKTRGPKSYMQNLTPAKIRVNISFWCQKDRASLQNGQNRRAYLHWPMMIVPSISIPTLTHNDSTLSKHTYIVTHSDSTLSKHTYIDPWW